MMNRSINGVVFISVPMMLVILFAGSQQAVNGFSTTTCISSRLTAGRAGMTIMDLPYTRTGMTSTSKTSWLLAATRENEEMEATDVEIDGEEAEPQFEPHPPKVAPVVDEQLERDLRESTRRVMLYEKEIEMVREQLDLKQDELLDERNVFRDEKSSLLKKIGEFTNILAQRDEELAAKNKILAESKSKDAEVRKEIDELQSKLADITKSYENEKKVTEALQKQYSDSQDALEFEQMSFQREKQALQQSIDDQKKALKELEAKLKASEGTFDETRKELEAKIEAGEQKLAETKEKWEQTQQELSKVEKDLRDSLQQREKVLKESRETISQERGKFDTERKELQAKIVEEEAKVEDAKRELNQEQKRFTAAKNNLEKLLQEEKEGLKNLQIELIQEQQKFENEKTALELRIKTQGDKLAQVEKELSEERDTFSKEKAELERKLSEEIRVGKLKKRVMNDRYTEIRKEMTALWEGAKRDARREEARLKKKYSKKIASIEEKVGSLEDQLDTSMKANSDLRIRMAGLEKEKVNLKMEKDNLEKKYVEKLWQRDASIGQLQTNIDDLSKIIREKELCIDEQDERITKYETSFRQVAKLSVKVTGNKLKGAGRRLKRLIQNSPPPDEDFE